MSQMRVGIVLGACLVVLLFMKHSKGRRMVQHATFKRIKPDLSPVRNIGVQMCVDECKNTALCTSFIFVKRSLNCRLYQRAVTRQIKGQLSGRIKILERKWRRCPERPCKYGTKCLTTRLGGSKCIATGRMYSASSRSRRKRTSTSKSVKIIQHVARSFTEDAIYGFSTKLTLSMDYVRIAYNGSFEHVAIKLNPRKKPRSYVCSILSMSQAPCGKFTCVYVVGIVAGKTKQRLVYFKRQSSHRGALHDNNVFLRSKLSIMSMAVCRNREVYILGRQESSNLIHYYQKRQNVLIFKKEHKLTDPVLSIHFAFKKVELSLVTSTDICMFAFPLQRPMSPKSCEQVNVHTSKIVCLSPDEMALLQVDHKHPFRLKAIK